MDKKCKGCGKKGVTDCGLCLTCVGKRLIIDPKTEYRGGEMVTGIGERVIEAMMQQTNDLIQTHKRGIQKAFSAADDCKLKVGIAINIQQVAEKVLVETAISYTVEKVSDKQSGFIDENQVLMFPEKASNE
jgi:hypothetical protein